MCCKVPSLICLDLKSDTGWSMRKNIDQAFEEFILEAEFVRKVRPDTLRGYRLSFKLLTNLVSVQTPVEISPSHLMEFFKLLQERKRIVGAGIVKTGIKNSTAASHWTKLNMFFKWLVMKGYISENPFRTLKYPTSSYEDKKYLEKQEVERILTAIHMNHCENPVLFKRNLVLFHLLLFCGLRKEEVMHLQIRDIDFTGRMLTVRGETSKTGKSRFIPIHSSTLMHLRDYVTERKDYKTPYVIVSNHRDDKLTYHGLKHLVNKIRKTSGVHFSLHQFRHTFAVNFLKSTNNIYKLQKLLGHSNINVTTLYLRCLPPEELREDIQTLSIENFI